MLSADQKGHEVWGRECVRRQGCQVLHLFSSLIEPWESFHKDLIKMPKNNKTTLFSGNFTVYCTVKHGKSYYRYFFKTNRLLTNYIPIKKGSNTCQSHRFVLFFSIVHLSF